MTNSLDMTAYLIETQQRHSHIWSFLPAVIYTLCITIKEPLQLVIRGRLVEVMPLLCIVNPQPVSVSIVLDRDGKGTIYFCE